MTQLDIKITYEDIQSGLKLIELSKKIQEGGKTGICCGTFRESKLLFRFLEATIPFVSVKHESDCYTLIGNNWSVTALPATERICGYRFDNLIYTNLVPEDILIPMLNVRTTEKEGWMIEIS